MKRRRAPMSWRERWDAFCALCELGWLVLKGFLFFAREEARS